MSDASIEHLLKARWDELNGWMIAEKRNSWWRQLNDNYSDPLRFYHTLKHIHHMFENYDLYKDNLTNRVACAYAIFFHDIIYDPKHSDNNEKSSSEEFMIFCKETALQDASLIASLIEMTRSQCTEAHLQPGVYGSDDVHFLLDFDLAILGSSDQEYDDYKEAIQKEYSHLSELSYKVERLKVLKLFLQIPNIYATKIFRDAFETKARSNIKREIDELSK